MASIVTTSTSSNPSIATSPAASQPAQLISTLTIIVCFCIVAKFNKKHRLGLTQLIRLSLDSLLKPSEDSPPQRIASTLFNDKVNLSEMSAEAVLALITPTNLRAKSKKNKANTTKSTSKSAQKKQGNHIFNNPIAVLAEALEAISAYISSLPLAPNQKRELFIIELQQSVDELMQLAEKFETDCRENFTVDDNDLPSRVNNITDANAILFGLLSNDLQQTVQKLCKEVAFDNLYLRQAFRLDELTLQHWGNLTSVKASIDKDAFCQFKKEPHKNDQLSKALKLRVDYLQQALQILKHVTLTAIDWSEMKVKKPNIFASHKTTKSDQDLLEKLKQTQLKLEFKNDSKLKIIVLKQKSVNNGLKLTYTSAGELISTEKGQTKETQQAYESYLRMNGITLDELIAIKVASCFGFTPTLNGFTPEG